MKRQLIVSILIICVFSISSNLAGGINENHDSLKNMGHFIAEDLFILSIDADKFNAIVDDRYVFAFALFNNQLTLNGWKAEGLWGHKYGVPPDLSLSIYKKSGVTLQPNVNFGNVILQKKEVKKIKKAIPSKSMGKVLFVPDIIKNEIVYKIYTEAKSKNGQLSIMKFDDLNYEYTGIEMNPSPPKNYNSND